MLEYNDDIYNYAKSFVEAADEALFSEDFTNADTGWQKYLDMESFVDWYLINEIGKNNDAIFWSSCYMNLKNNGKLKMGPLWDFDLAFGNYVLNPSKSTNEPEGFYIKNVKWYTRLFQDPVFVNRVKERFNDYYLQKENVLNHIDAKSSVLINKVIEENRLWGRITSSQASESEVIDAYQEKVNELKTWFTTRLEWLNTNISAL